MKFWDNIIQTAMLGTGKRDISEDDFPEDILIAVKTINENETIDKEEKFLQTTSLAFNYRQSGITPLNQVSAILSKAPVEEKQYCHADSVQVLKDILFEESVGLLKIWLQLCLYKKQIIIPALVPALLNKSAQHKSIKTSVQYCIGNRGAWLSQFNNDWNFTKEATLEDLWQTGTPTERKNVLQQLRNSDATKAREWLRETWAVENANTKNDLLSLLYVNLSIDDAEWLEDLLNEKSQKVREQAIYLLKQIPASSIVQKYQQLLANTVTTKKERGLLGLSSKMVIHFKLPEAIGEDVFKYGIEKLSNKKGFDDDQFILYQLMQSVPPDFWEQQFSLSPSEIIQVFQKDEAKKKFIPAIVIATVQFKDIKWATALMKDSQVFYLDIIPLLPLEQQEFYSNKFFAGNEESIIRYAVQREEEWSVELTQNIFRYAAKNYYNYNRSFYNEHIQLFPVQVVGILEKCTPQDEQFQNVWSNTSEYIIKLITLKIRTIQSFQ